MEESERKLRHANKLVAAMRNDRETLHGELESLKNEGDAYSNKVRLEAAEVELRESRKEIERLSKKSCSRACIIS